jgi:hypothetical protein
LMAPPVTISHHWTFTQHWTSNFGELSPPSGFSLFPTVDIVL